MTDEKDLVEVTIRVDMSTGVTLDHVCAKCGATARSKPISFEHADYATGMEFDGDVFVVRQTLPPKGWEHFRIEYASGNGTKHVEVCPVRSFDSWSRSE